MNISPNFSPSIKLMKPYFLLSSFFYVVSMLWIFFINPFSTNDDFHIVGWVHLYLIGFIMLGIFSAMAQLGPIVVETKHYAVGVFRFLWIFISIGLSLLVYGFYQDPLFLLIGGAFVFIAILIYAIEFALTLNEARRHTTITHAMKTSNMFLILGLVNGLVMAFSLNGFIHINITDMLHAHTFGLVVGFVILLIMGISIILIPMFGSAKRISDNAFSASFLTLSIGVIVMLISPSLYTQQLQQASYGFSSLAILIYFYQLFKMLHSRAKPTHDIWAKHMYVGFTSFIVSFLLFISYYIENNIIIFNVATWILFIGFFAFLIFGNFYKIVPFLVWFQIYSPLVEEQEVPMLHQLIDQKMALWQFIFSFFGLLVSIVGLFFSQLIIFYTGIGFLFIGGVLFFINIYKVLAHKGEYK